MISINIICIGVLFCLVAGGLICYMANKPRTGVILLIVGFLGVAVVVNYCQSPDITLVQEYEETSAGENYIVDGDSCYVFQNSSSTITFGDEDESYEIKIDDRTSVFYKDNNGSDNAYATVRNYLRIYETHWRIVEGRTKVNEREVVFYLPKGAKIEYNGKNVFTEARS